jgi:Holliday junction resolvase RusA-like endonuclease
MRTVFRKFILKDEESKQDAKFKDDFDNILREIKDHLNMHKFIRMS